MKCAPCSPNLAANSPPSRPPDRRLPMYRRSPSSAAPALLCTAGLLTGSSGGFPTPAPKIVKTPPCRNFPYPTESKANIFFPTFAKYFRRFAILFLVGGTGQFSSPIPDRSALSGNRSLSRKIWPAAGLTRERPPAWPACEGAEASNRHFSQGSIFAGSGGAERAWRVVFRRAVVLEAVQQLRKGSFSAPKLDSGHSSAGLLARWKWKSLFGWPLTLSSAARRRPGRRCASTDRRSSSPATRVGR